MIKEGTSRFFRQFSFLKDDMPVSFMSELYTSYFLSIFKQWTCQILLSMHVKILQKKMNLLKMCGPQIRLCLLTFRPIASKQFNSLTTLVTFSWLGGSEVTHSLRCPGFISLFRQGFLCMIFFRWCVFF